MRIFLNSINYGCTCIHFIFCAWWAFQFFAHILLNSASIAHWSLHIIFGAPFPSFIHRSSVWTLSLWCTTLLLCIYHLGLLFLCAHHYHCAFIFIRLGHFLHISNIIHPSFIDQGIFPFARIAIIVHFIIH